MKATAYPLGIGSQESIVLVEYDKFTNTVISVRGPHSEALAKDFAGMINRQQCPECGRFGGAHGDIFIKTGQDGFGSVEGHYVKCSHLESA